MTRNVEARAETCGAEGKSEQDAETNEIWKNEIRTDDLGDINPLWDWGEK